MKSRFVTKHLAGAQREKAYETNGEMRGRSVCISMTLTRRQYWHVCRVSLDWRGLGGCDRSKEERAHVENEVSGIRSAGNRYMADGVAAQEVCVHR